MAQAKKNKLESLPMLPLRGLMVFPHMVIHFDVGRKKSVQALERAMVEDQRIFLAAQRDADVDDPKIQDICDVGTIASVKQVLKLPGDTLRVLVEGLCRARLKSIVEEEPCYVASVQADVQKPVRKTLEVQALMRTTCQFVEEFGKVSGRLSGETVQSILSIDDPGQLADVIAANVLGKLEDRQDVLEQFDPVERLETVCTILANETELAGVERQVQARVKKQI